MSQIPVSVTESQFNAHIRPHLRVAKRGYESQIPLYRMFNYVRYGLHTGCQWQRLPLLPRPGEPEKKEISWQAVYHHFRQWSQDGSLKRRWAYSILVIKHQLDRRSLNLDGSHALAKKGGEQVAYQERKNGKTTNILPMTDAQGYVIAATDLIAGNHHDAFNLKAHLQQAFGWLKRLGIPLLAVYFNADSAFDTLPARKVCFNYGLIPNIAENKRNRKCVKRGPKRHSIPTFTKNAL